MINFYICIVSVGTHTFSFMESCKGNQMLVIDRYRYTLVRHLSKGLRNKWRCGRHSLGCKATAITVEKKLVAVNRWHDHEPCPPKRKGN